MQETQVWSLIDPGRSHMLQSNEAHTPQLLSLYSRAWEATTTEAPVAHFSAIRKKKKSHHNEKPAHGKERVAPACCN